MIPHRTVFALACGLALVASRPSAAQTVHGVVRDTTARQPIAGAVLLVVDSVGNTVTRNITDAVGSYRIATTAQMRRMRVLRIGFRPREVSLPDVSSGDVELSIAMTPIPTLLEAVRVTSGARCSPRDDRLPALSLLDQARAGLLATVVAREAKPAEMIRLRYSRILDSEKKRLSVYIDSTSDLSASFKAVRSAADFVKLGFLDTLGGYAPDAETLLDDNFRDGYCFALRDHDSKRPTSVGLAFAAAESQKDRIDIDGTLWVDTAARKLEHIEFDYVGLPRNLQKLHPGGDIRFREAGNGVVLIDRWSLRVPTTVIETVTVSRVQRALLPFLKTQETGGAVASARWPDKFTFQAPLPVARVHVVDESDQPVRGAYVTLNGTDYRAISDGGGTAAIDRLVPGYYEGVVIDPKLASIGVRLTTPLKFTVSERDSANVSVKAVSLSAYVGEACKRDRAQLPIDRKGAWIIARVVDADARPVKVAQWRALKSVNGDWTPIKDAQGTTSSAGLLEYCGGELHQGDEVRVESRSSLQDPWHPVVLKIDGPANVAVVHLPLRDGL